MSEPVIIALISAVPGGLAALGALVHARRSDRSAAEAADIVRGNGRGTVTQMLELVITEQRRQGMEIEGLRLEDRRWRDAHERDHHALGA